jgi:hypothetical protein
MPTIPRRRNLAILLPADRGVRIGRRPRVLFAHLNQQKRYGGDRSRDHKVFVIISILVKPRASQFRHVCSTCAFLISSRL